MANDFSAELKPLQAPDEIKTFESGSRYESYEEDGVYEYLLKPNGRPDKSQAKIKYNHGDVFSGSLKRGKYNGTGKYTWKDGGIYEGEFKKGFLAGNGKYTAANGDSYEGSFKGNKYEGQGKYTWADGSVFEGTFKAGLISEGKFTDSVGNLYQCKFTYGRNGERKNSNIRLIKFAANKSETTEKKKEAKKKAAEKKGLLSKDEKLLTVIRNSKRGAEFKNLYSGAAGKSEKAERNLITILNFFSNSDAEQMTRIFKTSALYDKTKGDEHVTDMITGVIKRSKDFTSVSKANANTRQSSATATKKGAAR